MLYIFETNILENKSVFFSLRSIYGLNSYNISLICRKMGFSKNLKVKDLSENQVIKLVRSIESLNIELTSDLKKSRQLTDKRFLEIKSYKGLRKNQGLPIRGQRTHTNSKTAKKTFKTSSNAKPTKKNFKTRKKLKTTKKSSKRQN